MASVYLRFLPPDRDDIVKLFIFEAPTADGVLSQIEEVTSVGTYPNYIDEYTTQNAADATHWFAIQWEDSGGALTDMSARVQGGLETLVSVVTDRVLLRDGSLNRSVVAQEAEAVISEYFGVADPLSVKRTDATAKEIGGVTMMTLARVYIMRVVITSQSANRWAAGIVSMDATSTSSSSGNVAWQNIEKLIELANRELGKTYSAILLMKEIEVAGRYRQLHSADVSRLLVEIS